MHAGHLAATRAGQADVPAWPGAVAGEPGAEGASTAPGCSRRAAAEHPFGYIQTACGNVNTRSGS